LDPKDKTLSVAIFAANPARAALVEDGLRQAGFTRLTLIADATRLARQIDAIAPDALMIDVETPSRTSLDRVFQIARAFRGPIAVFVDDSDSATIQASVEAGVSAFIVDGLTKKRVRPVLELAISRFNAVASLQGELDAARTELAGRKVIERAKGILMRRKGLSEEEAYGLLRQTAMNQNRKISEVAGALVAAADLLDE
jgi:response regulator NasT